MAVTFRKAITGIAVAACVSFAGCSKRPIQEPIRKPAIAVPVKKTDTVKVQDTEKPDTTKTVKPAITTKSVPRIRRHIIHKKLRIRTHGTASNRISREQLRDSNYALGIDTEDAIGPLLGGTGRRNANEDRTNNGRNDAGSTPEENGSAKTTTTDRLLEMIQQNQEALERGTGE